MGYPFGRAYVWLTHEATRSINERVIRLDYRDPERNHLEMIKYFLEYFIVRKERIEKKIVSLQYDAYSTGEAIGALADDMLYSVWKELVLGYQGNFIKLFKPLVDIECGIDEIIKKIEANKKETSA